MVNPDRGKLIQRAHLEYRVVHDPRVRLLAIPQVVMARRQHQVEVVDVGQPRDACLEVPACIAGMTGSDSIACSITTGIRA